MKKLNILLSALVLTSTMPVFAAFCTNCGNNIADGANFCSNCGKAATGAFQEAEPEKNASLQAAIAQTQVPGEMESLADYHFINKIEECLAEASSNSALRQCQEIKRQNAAKLQQMDSEYAGYSNFRRKIHDLHLKKLNALENYIEARKGSENGNDRARNKAQMCKELFIVDKMNEAIDMLITGGNTVSNISKVNELENRVKKTTANYIVTSQYLTLGNVRVKRNEPIWIEDVSGAAAKVYHMGSSVSDEPAYGEVSVYDLMKRSNWTPDSSFYYSAPNGTTVVYTQPAKVVETTSVLVWNGFYPYSRWHHRPIFGGPRYGHRPPPPPHRAPHGPRR